MFREVEKRKAIGSVDGYCYLCASEGELETIVNNQIVAPHTFGDVEYEFCSFCVKSGLANRVLKNNLNFYAIARAIGYLANQR